MDVKVAYRALIIGIGGAQELAPQPRTVLPTRSHVSELAFCDLLNIRKAQRAEDVGDLAGHAEQDARGLPICMDAVPAKVSAWRASIYTIARLGIPGDDRRFLRQIAWITYTYICMEIGGRPDRRRRVIGVRGSRAPMKFA
jgi:hypothetical protein